MRRLLRIPQSRLILDCVYSNWIDSHSLRSSIRTTDGISFQEFNGCEVYSEDAIIIPKNVLPNSLHHQNRRISAHITRRRARQPDTKWTRLITIGNTNRSEQRVAR